MTFEEKQAQADEWLEQLKIIYKNSGELYTVEQVAHQLCKFMHHVIEACEMAKRHAELDEESETSVSREVDNG